MRALPNNAGGSGGWPEEALRLPLHPIPNRAYPVG
jgi:hypothetical protein